MANEKAGEWWSKVKSTVGYEEEEADVEDASLLQQFREATTMSKTQRVYGFLICLGLALFFGLMSTLFTLMPTKFAVLFTFANLFAIGSTMFLSGPMTHIKKMFEKGRIIATILYVVSMCITLFCALKLHSAVLTLLAMILQLCCLIWYSLSYVPYARQVASRLFGIEMPSMSFSNST